jgi:hypothetical protein
MDAIDLTKNCVTTECGHNFHAKCLMQNVAHNGFDCPYCRATMAEEVSQEDDDDDDDSFFSNDEDEEVSELYSDRALFAMRSMFRMNSGEDVVEEDSEEEEDDEEDEDTVDGLTTDAIPVDRVVQNLQSQFSYEQLVRIILQLNNFDYQNGPNRTDRDEIRLFDHFHRQLERSVDAFYADRPAVAPANIAEPVSEPLPNPSDHIAIPVSPEPIIHHQRFYQFL